MTYNPSPRESDIEKAVCSYARKAGCIVLKGDPRNNRGAPDRILLRRGKVLLIEFKRAGAKPRPNQLKWQRHLTDGGFTALVIDNIADGLEAVDEYLLKDE